MPELPQPDPGKFALFPDNVPDPPAGVFEIGLVLGGTVSAGAYTAGALDLLMQALDRFYSDSGGNPPHRVRLMLAAGSSGGAVCASLLGASINRRFTYVSGTQAELDADRAGPADNPFWNLWVNSFDFAALMATDDLGRTINDGDAGASQQHVPALLNGGMIDAGVAALVTYAGAGGDTIRPWASQPLHIATTVCNLRGIPYTIQNIPSYAGYTGASYVEHDDFAWFALPNVLAADDTGDDNGTRRPDEFWVSIAPQAPLSVSFQTLADFARASGAMPVGLPARALSRPAIHYAYRPDPRPVIGGQPAYQIDWPQPDWSELGDVSHGLDYAFSGVDGGTLNNDPVKIAHDRLAGLVGSNPRTPGEANRALFLIDPLADEPSTLGNAGLSLVGVAKALIGTFVGGARYLTSDLELFADQNVFSRFQLVPTRSNPDQAVATRLTGEAALAGTDLAALGGWLARPYRVHDYLLGQWNMLNYLRGEFLLSGDNTLFNGWTFDARADAACDLSGTRIAITPQTPPKTYFLPIIPIPADNFQLAEPAWPTTPIDFKSLEALISTRAAAVVGQLRADNLPGVGPWLVSQILIPLLSGTLASDVVWSLKQTLLARKLVPQPAADA
jgi:hypothetical protein